MRSISRVNGSSLQYLYILLLGFSSGLPIMLVSATLQAWFAAEKLDIFYVGLLGFVQLPYFFKWLWSPFFDRFLLTWPLFSGRRGWVSLSQIVCVLSLLLLSIANPVLHPGLTCLFAGLVAFSSATQDVVIDAYRILYLKGKDQARGVAIFTAAFRAAMMFSGGAALIIADNWGWSFTYTVMAVVMGLCFVATFMCPKLDISSKYSSVPMFSFMFASIRSMFYKKDKSIWMFFIVFYRSGEFFLNALMPTYLIREVGLSLSNVGLLYKGVGLFATILGSFVIAWILEYIGMWRMLLIIAFSHVVVCLLFIFLLSYNLQWQDIGFMHWFVFGLPIFKFMHVEHVFIMIIVVFQCFIDGGSSSLLTTFMMRFVDAQYPAMQYAILSSAVSSTRIVLPLIAVYLAEHFGWGYFFGFAAVLVLPCIFILLIMQFGQRFASWRSVLVAE